MKDSAQMIPANSARTHSVVVLLTSALVRHRLGMLILLVAPPAAVARGPVRDAPPPPAAGPRARGPPPARRPGAGEPVISHEDLAKVALPNTTIDSVELD